MYFMKRALIYFISFFFIVSLKADYPLFWQQYAADPSGIEYNGRLYSVLMILIILIKDMDIS